MSSSTTETVDVRCPRWGCRSPRAPSSSGRSRSATGSRPTRSSARSRRTRSTPTWRRPRPGGVRRSASRSARRSRSASCWPRSRPTPSPGEPHVSESSSPRGRARPRSRSRPPARPGELQGDTADADATAASAQAGAARRGRGGRRYSPVVMRMAAEHDLDLVADRGDRSRRARAQAGRARVPRGRRRAGARPSRRCTSSRPTSPTSRCAPKKRAPRFGARRSPEPAPLTAGGAAVAHAPVDRPGDGRVAADRGDVHDDRRGGHDARRRGPQAARRRRTCRSSRARRSRRSASYPALNATLDGETLRRYDGGAPRASRSRSDEGGLIVPVIRDAQELSVEGLGGADQGRRDAGARRTRSQPDEVRGGTFTITNPGGYGSIMATPVINQPQVAILDTEAVVKRPGRGHRRARQRLDRDPAHDLPVHELGPPRARRRAAARFLRALADRLEAWPVVSAVRSAARSHMRARARSGLGQRRRPPSARERGASARSIPQRGAPAVTTSPSSTTRASTHLDARRSRAGRRARRGFVVARRPRRTPAWASRSAPVQTEATSEPAAWRSAIARRDRAALRLRPGALGARSNQPPPGTISTSGRSERARVGADDRAVVGAHLARALERDSARSRRRGRRRRRRGPPRGPARRARRSRRRGGSLRAWPQRPAGGRAPSSGRNANVRYDSCHAPRRRPRRQPGRRVRPRHPGAGLRPRPGAATRGRCARPAARARCRPRTASTSSSRAGSTRSRRRTR